ncbi:DUF2829 domain-containing protein [Pluralibacter gergoviae]|uniref:DUF2829 domain-containing protein n=1 Tax=Pluralibacter gergoviae TaxID=61647 RepID=A0AAI9DMB3_PLUGE|nr:DUF2829 domain-containing protein [Pluralibacter gergoviae]EKV0916169.1 DUF2829 domain-containing protein [Pluralibacter gergoviae]EKV9908668.1 DUF2829 domain-containing protein [Pluralibacter gergoviae]EKW7276196.1 DUF2829 domain-containing protein [Pluralibacter gergoviae]ELD4296302.1 DUF2829 domain-containing protein [Pluralibacter gergoviae]ELD4306803.1 DUF2829 domain-containing protein [Pluralibacter gergoviae]
MADLTAVEGSFEWAMLELKSGKRVSREAWKDRNMYLVLNPGEPGQTVKDGDWRALAGVPVDTKFDYLPNIEICNAEGNFVPYQPSQVDMEMKDWEELANSSEYDLVVDITNGYWIDSIKGYQGWGYAIGTKAGKCSIIENSTLVKSVQAFEYWTGENHPNGLAIDISFSKNTGEYYILSKPLTIIVDGNSYNLGVGTELIIQNYFSSNHYPLEKFPELRDKFMTENETHSFYCKWAD